MKSRKFRKYQQLQRRERNPRLWIDIETRDLHNPDAAIIAVQRETPTGRWRSPRNEPRMQPYMPIYQPGDPRIQRDLDRGAGVGIDYSSVERRVAMHPALGAPYGDRQTAKSHSAFLGLMYGTARKLKDLVSDANRQMLTDDARYPQEDEDDSQ